MHKATLSANTGLKSFGAGGAAFKSSKATICTPWGRLRGVFEMSSAAPDCLSMWFIRSSGRLKSSRTALYPARISPQKAGNHSGHVSMAMAANFSFLPPPHLFIRYAAKDLASCSYWAKVITTSCPFSRYIAAGTFPEAQVRRNKLERDISLRSASLRSKMGLFFFFFMFMGRVSFPHMVIHRKYGKKEPAWKK